MGLNMLTSILYEGNFPLFLEKKPVCHELIIGVDPLVPEVTLDPLKKHEQTRIH